MTLSLPPVHQHTASRDSAGSARLAAAGGAGSSLASMFPPLVIDIDLDISAAANAHRQPAPPPQLPLLQVPGRHQEKFRPASTVTIINEIDGDESDDEDPGDANGQYWQPHLRCPQHIAWPEPGEHYELDYSTDQRVGRFSDAELETIVADFAVLVRREFDCWVESCWTEAFHHVFTRTIPTFLISMILAGASPKIMRKQIVHGGPAMDRLFMADMLGSLYDELENRISGRTMPEQRGEGSSGSSTAAAIGIGGFGAQPHAHSHARLHRDGVCMHDLAPMHGLLPDEDNHAACLCQLLHCTSCLHAAVQVRKGPISLLPVECAGHPCATAFAGGTETGKQAYARYAVAQGSAVPSDMDIGIDEDTTLPPGKGFVRHTKKHMSESRRPTVFPHPQMTDVLAVEEHMRWRLKELGAVDPAVEARYGPCSNAPVALEGLERALKLEDDDESVSSTGKNGRRVVVGKNKARFNKTVKAPPKKKVEKKVYLPKEWAEAEPSERNIALTLTFRHFVKLLHQAAMNATPFAYTGYARDVAALNSVHPIALYRKLTEGAAQGRTSRTSPRTAEGRDWSECMEKWCEELGAREKAAGNVLVNAGQHMAAAKAYSRAIGLDGKKTVYYSNRAVALNAVGLHREAEADCWYIISKDAKNSKAYYQRAVARKGMERWREAEADLKQVLRLQPGNEAAKTLLDKIKPELAKLPKQKLEDVLNF